MKIENLLKKLQEKYPKMEFYMDDPIEGCEDYILSDKMDYYFVLSIGVENKTQYNDFYFYLTIGYDQFSEAKYPETFEKLIQELDNVITSEYK